MRLKEIYKMFYWNYAYIIGFILALIPFNSCVKNNSGQKPNIVLFFADDMGYGDLSCFGSPNIKTPNIDKLANEGIKLTSFYVAGPVCTPSRAGLMAGRYPLHTLGGNLGPGSKGGLPQNEPIIPEVLKDAGYRSMAIGKWHLGHAKKELLPTGRGFDHFYGLPYSNDMIKPWVNTDIPPINNKRMTWAFYSYDSNYKIWNAIMSKSKVAGDLNNLNCDELYLLTDDEDQSDDIKSTQNDRHIFLTKEFKTFLNTESTHSGQLNTPEKALNWRNIVNSLPETRQ